MTPKKDRKFLDGLRRRDESAVEYLNENIFPMILKLVTCNKGSHQDAEDIFQEGLLIVLEKLRDDNFKLTCKFTTYFWEICKRLWLKELRKRRRKEIDFASIQEKYEQISYDSIIEKKQVELFLKHLKTLSVDCQKVLLLHFDKRSINEIMSIMRYSSKQICQDKKYRCKKRLMELIMQDPDFKKLKHELLITH